MRYFAGVMEEWSIGVLKRHFTRLSFQIPLLHYFIAPVLHETFAQSKTL